jgi:flagellar motor switch protein FliG
MPTILTGEERGALVLKSLAPPVVEKILSQLPAERRSKLQTIMQRLEDSPENRKVLDQFLSEIAQALENPESLQADQGKSNGLAQSRQIKEAESFPTEEEIANEPLNALTKFPPEKLARALEGEASATISLIMNYLDISFAGEVYKLLSSGIRREVSIQLSTTLIPGIEVVHRVAQALARKGRLLGSKPAIPDTPARVKKMADMLRMLPKNDRMEILTSLQEKNEALAVEVKNQLYRFEDVLRLDNRSVQRLLGELETSTLALAMKSTSDEIKEKFLSNMPKRAQDTLAEEMEMSGTVQPDQIQGAQKTIVEALQRLDQSNEITLTL